MDFRGSLLSMGGDGKKMQEEMEEEGGKKEKGRDGKGGRKEWRERRPPCPLWMRAEATTWSNWSNCVKNKLYAIYQVGTVGHNRTLINRNYQHTSNWSYSSHRLLRIIGDVTINQLVALVDIHLVRHEIYHWTVLISKISDEGTSLLPVPEIYLKVLTIELLLILSRRFGITGIVYCNDDYSHFSRSFYLSLSFHSGTLYPPFQLQNPVYLFLYLVIVAQWP